MKIEVKENISLLEFVLKYFPQVSVTKAKKMILYNCFSIGGASIKSFEYMLEKGTTIDYRKYSGGMHIAKEKRDIAVLYEDNNILVVNKPFGQKVIDPKDRKNEDMLTEVKRYVHKRMKSAAVYVIFAPDTYESGLCIFSKNKFAYEKMSEQIPDMNFGIDVICCNRPKHKNDKIKFFFKESKNNYNISSSELSGYKTFTIQYKTIEDLSSEEENFFMIHLQHKGYIPFLTRAFLNNINIPVVGDIRFDKQRAKNILKFFVSSIEFQNIINSKKTKVVCKLPNTFNSFNVPVHNLAAKEESED